MLGCLLTSPFIYANCDEPIIPDGFNEENNSDVPANSAVLDDPPLFKWSCLGSNQSDLPAKLDMIHFIQVSKSAGISRKTNKAWANPIWGDINNDDFLDLIVPAHGHTPGIYLNQGNGTFVSQEATKTFFPEFPEEHHDRHGFSFTDFDNDGNLDLYITVGAKRGQPGFTKKDLLYWGNGDGTFINVSTEVGV